MNNLSQEKTTVELRAFSVPEFCQAHRISRAFFYKLLKAKSGPRILKLGYRTIVSAEAAAEWRNRPDCATLPGRGRKKVLA
jgi:predicted DNA-binding transcriptional regulator AlpA